MPPLPAPRRVARAGRPREGPPLPRRDVLGPAGARVRRSGRADPADRAGAGGPRRQPDGPGLHRRRLGRLPVGGAPRRGPGRPAGLAPRRRRPDPDRHVHRGGRPLRAAGQQADDRPSATPARRSSCARSGCSTGWTWSSRSASSAGTRRSGRSPRWATQARPRPRFGHGAEAAIGPVPAPRLVPPEPAEHVHRPADAPMFGASSAARASWRSDSPAERTRRASSRILLVQPWPPPNATST